MDLDQLVEAVYQKLSVKWEQETKLGSVCVLSDKRALEIEQIFGESYSIVYFSKENNLEHASYKMVIIPRLTVTMLANLANGLGTTAEEQFVLYQLLKGQRIVVLQNGVEHYEYKKQSPVLLYKVYEEYEKKLKGFGVSFLYCNELLIEPEPLAEEELTGSVEQPESPLKKTIMAKKVISEADLQKLFLQGLKEITISKKSIITPLAQDYIRTHHVLITRQSEEWS